MRRLLLTGVLALFVGAFLIPPVGAQTAAGDDGGRFTCRASVVRIEDLVLVGLFEPFVANPDGDDCETDDSGLINNAMLPSGLGSLSAVSAATEHNPDQDASARANVVTLLLTVPGLPAIEADVLTAEATAGPCPAGDQLSGDSTVVGLRIGGQVVEVPPGGHLDIPLPGGLATLHLNEQIDEGNRLTVRALWLEVPAGSPVRTVVGDIIVSEAIVDVHGDPCARPEQRPPGLMTGEGTVADPTSSRDTNDEGVVEPGTNVKYKFKLDCFVEPGVDPRPGRESLVVHSLDEAGRRSQFTLTQVVDNRCFDDPAVPNPPGSAFDTLEGTGTGNCRLPDGRQTQVNIAYRFSDAGSGGTQDRARITTTLAPGSNPPPDVAAACVYHADGFLDAGDNQAQT